MSKTIALVWLTLLSFVYLLLTAVLVIPYGMAEPGRPERAPALLLLWPWVELAWTCLAFDRRPRKALEGFFRVERPRALLTVAVPALTGVIVGFFLIFNQFYVVGPMISAGITTAGCWMARLHLRGADVDHRM
jgi:hypothetical protein